MAANRQVHRDELIDFVYHEARLLDDKRYDEWFALFTEDGNYWMPLERNQANPIDATSLIYDDAVLIEIRIERTKDIRAYSLQPEVHSHHLLARPLLEHENAAQNEYLMRTDFQYTEVKGDDLERLSATAYHTITLVDGKLRLKQKKVALLNCESALPPIQLYP